MQGKTYNFTKDYIKLQPNFLLLHKISNLKINYESFIFYTFSFQISYTYINIPILTLIAPKKMPIIKGLQLIFKYEIINVFFSIKLPTPTFNLLTNFINILFQFYFGDPLKK